MLAQVAVYKQQKPKHLLGVFIFHFIVERQQQRLWPSAMDFFFSIVGRFGWPLEEAEGIILRWNSDLVWWLKLAGFPFFSFLFAYGCVLLGGWVVMKVVGLGRWSLTLSAIDLFGVAQLWWFLFFLGGGGEEEGIETHCQTASIMFFGVRKHLEK